GRVAPLPVAGGSRGAAAPRRRPGRCLLPLRLSRRPLGGVSFAALWHARHLRDAGRGRRRAAGDRRSWGGAESELVAKRSVLVVHAQRNRHARRAVRDLEGSERPLGATPAGLEPPK